MADRVRWNAFSKHLDSLSSRMAIWQVQAKKAKGVVVIESEGLLSYPMNALVIVPCLLVPPTPSTQSSRQTIPPRTNYLYPADPIQMNQHVRMLAGPEPGPT